MERESAARYEPRCFRSQMKLPFGCSEVHRAMCTGKLMTGGDEMKNRTELQEGKSIQQALGYSRGGGACV